MSTLITEHSLLNAIIHVKSLCIHVVLHIPNSKLRAALNPPLIPPPYSPPSPLPKLIGHLHHEQLVEDVLYH